MIRILFIALLAIPFLASGQETKPAKPKPEYTYITPQTSRQQLDSISVALKQHEMYLNFDTVIYDKNKLIKELSGSLEAKDQYFPLSSDNFKGITIITAGDSAIVIMGLLPKK